MDASAPRQTPPPRSAAWVRNLLIIFGIYWLSRWLIVPLGWPVAKLNNGHFIYNDSIFGAVAMGIMVSLDRALAAAFAGILAALVFAGRKSYWWALIIAALYLIDYRDHGSWAQPPTSWDYLWMRVVRFFPGIACIVAAFVTAYVRNKRRAKRESSAASGPVTTSN